MVESVIATKLDHPVFNPVEVGNGKNDRSLANEFNRRLNVENLASLLSAKGEVEGYPGWVQSRSALQNRITAINKAIPDFQRQSYKPLEPYQVWVVVLCHLDFFKITPADLKEAAIAIHKVKHKYTYEEYQNVKNRTTKANRTERDQVRQLAQQA